MCANVRRSGIISDMTTSTMAQIRGEFERTAPGTPIPTAQLLRYGTRAAVDQSLTRLVRSGLIQRAARGVYYRPKSNRLVGPVPLEPSALVKALAKSRGESVAIHGAEAARQLGLSTQTPLSPVYLTSGPTRTLRMGKNVIRLQHAPQGELAHAGQPAGTALSALRYLGPDRVTPEVIAKVRSALPESEFRTLREESPAMPSWLSDAFFRLERRERSRREELAVA